MRLTLIRGLPGSGKTTMAQEIVQLTGAVHVEGDHYFEAGGKYFFDAEWLGEAHQRCHRLAQAALLEGNDVVVSNTFTRIWEMQGYIDMSALPLVDLVVIHCADDYGSIHGCPDGVIEKMRDRWETYGPEVIYGGAG